MWKRKALVLFCTLIAANSAMTAQRGGEIRRAARPVRGEYVVILRDDADPQAVGREAVGLFGGRLKHVYTDAVRGFAVRMSEQGARALAADPRIVLVEENGVIHAAADEPTASWALDRIDQRTLPLDNEYHFDATGAGVNIYVVDSGVRLTHVDFGGRAWSAGDFTDDDLDGDPRDIANDDSDPSRPDGADCNGHGTHVASIAAGRNYGAAKEATIWSYRVLRCDGYGQGADAIAALDAILAAQARPGVVNLSIEAWDLASLDAAVQRVIDAGIPVVVAAGNDAISVTAQSPARLPAAITVGATTTADFRAPFSNYGPLLDLFAPGEDVLAAYYGDDTSLGLGSGTSMSAPFVAGVVAMLLETRPTLTPAEVQETIVTQASRARLSGLGAGSPNLLLYSAFVSPPVTLPAPWSTTDVGDVGLVGSASEASGVFMVRGAGSDVWGAADAFRFVYQPLAGDGTIVARVDWVQGTEAWTKAGVMIRSSLDPRSPHAFLIVSAGRGLAFQRRLTAGGITTHTSGGAGTAPRWVRIARQGNVISASVSVNAISWTVVGRDTIALPSTALVGLALTSHTRSQLATASFSGVSMSSTSATSLPDGWAARDIGVTGVAGTSVIDDRGLTVRAAGADIWGTGDAFRYVYRAITGDGTIVARVGTLTGTQAWTKAGVMIRDSLSPGSPHAFMLVSVARGLALQYRPSAGAVSLHVSGGAGTAPQWLRLSRSGHTVTASVSTTGTAWTTVGQVNVTLAPSVWVGLAVTSHDATRLATATFDSVAVLE